MPEKIEDETNQIEWENLQRISQDTYSNFMKIEVEEISRILDEIDLSNTFIRVPKIMLMHRLRELQQTKALLNCINKGKKLLIEKGLKSESFAEFEPVAQIQ